MSTAVLQTLNAEQQAAVDWPGSALVLAGAGTGKTRVITARVQRLLDEDVDPRSVLTVTFTKKAAIEMKDRIGTHTDVFVGTFHSLGARILHAHAEAAGLPPSFQVIDQDDQTVLIRRVLQEVMGLPKPKKGGPDPSYIKMNIDLFKQRGQRSEQVGVMEVLDDKRAEQIYDAYVEYERLCKEEGKVDFNELLLRPCELLESNEEIRARWSSRYAHILVDELQDTNELQLQMQELLKGPDTVMFGVGDDDQSIYKFRGAYPRVLKVFANKHTGGKVFSLERNYRSGKKILALANAVLIENTDRIGKNLYSDDTDGDLPTLTLYRDNVDEARKIASQIVALREAGESLDEIAVLYRKNRLSFYVEQALSQAGVKYTVRGGGFLARAEIKTAVAYLQVAAQRDNIDAVLRSVNAPPRKIGPKGKDKLFAAAQQGRLWETIAQGVQAGHVGLVAYAAIIDQIAEHAANGDLVAAVRTAVVDSGWQEYQIGRGEDDEGEKAESLGEMINIASRFAEDAGEQEAILDRFLEAVVLDSGPDDSGDKDEGVSLLTIHGAKGLEFAHVFLIGLLENVVLRRPLINDEDRAEERRLLHVAITRAKQSLHMSHVQERLKGAYAYENDRKRNNLLENVDPRLWQDVGGSIRQTGAGRLSDRQACRPERQTEHKASLTVLTVGQRVKSWKFGAGEVKALEGEGKLAKAKVLFFASRKTRWMMINIAKLESLP